MENNREYELLSGLTNLLLNTEFTKEEIEAEKAKEVVVDLDEIFEEIEDFNNKKESESLSEDDFL